MDRETFSSLLQGENHNRESLDQLKKLLEKYPYFNLASLLRLKIAHSAGIELDPEEISKAGIYSNNKRFLYDWMRGEVNMKFASTLMSNEIEFIEEADQRAENEDMFELIEGAGIADVENDEDLSKELDVRIIPEKDDADMEHPEVEEEIPVPVMEGLDEEDLEENEELSEETVENEEEKKRSIEKERNEVEEFQYASADFLLTNESKDSDPGVSHPNLIEQFLQSEGGQIQADQETSLRGDISSESIKEDDSFITDTLAKIYIKQGLHAKAIYAYERLSLKYPEKSAYFAAQIEKVKNNSNI